MALFYRKPFLWENYSQCRRWFPNQPDLLQKEQNFRLFSERKRLNEPNRLKKKNNRMLTERSRRWGHRGLNPNLSIYKSLFAFLESLYQTLPHPTLKGQADVGKADCRRRLFRLFPHTFASAVRFGGFRCHLKAEMP